MNPFEGQQWLLYVDVFGTIAVLSGFAFLFWTGKIMSIGTVNRIVDAYKQQADAVTAILMAELRTMVLTNEKSADGVLAAIRSWAADGAASRERMIEVTQSLEVSLARIDTKLNGGPTKAKRTIRRR